MALIEVREDWLAKVPEDIVDPARRIIDPHHHFFKQSPEFPYYDLASLRADTGGHGVSKTVFLQCGEGHREDGPEHLRPVGETEWVDGIAAAARKTPGAVQIGAIVGTCELRLGAAVREVLEAHRAASPLFRGIRQIAAWDTSEQVFSMPDLTSADLYRDPGFHAGFKVLGEMGLVFDAYHYHTQTPYLTELARAFPGIPIVIDHLGTPLGVADYANKRAEVHAEWQRGLAELATCPNVLMKLGGLMMPWTGISFVDSALPPTSDQVVAAHAAYYHYAIELFGPSRCMFESNFPVDKCGVSYPVLWNAFKKIAAQYSAAEQDAMFFGTAARFYGIEG